MIRIENLYFSYGASLPVLKNINLEVKEREILSILGPNGCGKSTLLRLLRGTLTPDQGQVLWQGRQTASLSRRVMAKLAAVVPQSSETAFPFTVLEMVTMGRFACQTGLFGNDRNERKAVEKAMALTDTLHLAERKSTDLSGGELQRVILARALAQEAPLLLLDEASSHLDLEHRLEFSELLVRLNLELGTTVVQVSHDLDLTAEISHRILLLDNSGSIVALGKPNEVFTSENLRKVFRVETKIENNPYTGAPRAYPVRNKYNQQQELPRIHLICGGGSGSELMRRFNLAGAKISVGPVNRGDSDQLLASALGLETIIEKPFCPISYDSMQKAKKHCYRAEVVIIAPTAWGAGNLDSLDMVKEMIDQNIKVLMIDPTAKRDFTGGKAWQKLQEIISSGGVVADDVSHALDLLGQPALTGHES
jgi:iron complex transport system ATP-binding protein